MSTTPNDPWQARLSAYLDGELGKAERVELEAHLGGCQACRGALDDLTRILRAARELPLRAPARDLWPEMALRLDSRRRSPALRVALAVGLTLAAGALLMFALFAAARVLPPDVEVATAAESYLFLLHEPPERGSARDSSRDSSLDQAQHAAVVERYAAWARSLGARCLGGEELADDGLVLEHPEDEPEPLRGGARIGGYFLVAARDAAEALALARTCPHLERGGSIELRRINVAR